MTRYKFDRGGHLIDQDGNVLLTVMATGCSRKFRDMAGKEMANKLNGIEQGKEAAARAEELRNLHSKPILRIPTVRIHPKP